MTFSWKLTRKAFLWVVCFRFLLQAVPVESFVGRSLTQKQTRLPIDKSSLLSSSPSFEDVSTGSGIDKDTPANGGEEVEEASAAGEREFPFVWERQWYPLMPIDYLKEPKANDNVREQIMKPKQVTVLGRKLVIWYNNNTGNDDGHNTTRESPWTVMEDKCPHRAAPLSTGKIIVATNNESSTSTSSTSCRNTIMCRFHGWEFDATGKCTKIPMQQQGGDAITPISTLAKATVFPCQVKGGLLWAFLDETVPVKDIPPIPADAYVDGDGSEMDFSVNTFPVSYMSMVENSFDPAHAPFIHEGTSEFGGMVYMPQNAIPIERYGFRDGTTSTLEGFVLEHTGYLRNNQHEDVTTRQFIPPCTQITKSTFFAAHLYFVPSGPRETMVLFSFPRLPLRSSGAMMKAKQMALTFLLPKSLQTKLSTLEHDMLHYAVVTSKSRRKFSAQDTLTMQGQDYNKFYARGAAAAAGSNDGSRVVLDMVPTMADQGVSKFQRWIKRFAGSGPFGADSRAITATTSTLNDVCFQPNISPWDVHMKHCPTCQRILKRMSFWGNTAQQASKRLLLACGALHFVTCLWTRRMDMSRVLYGGLLLAIMLRWATVRLLQEIEDAFITHDHARQPKHGLLEDVYAN